MILKPRVGTVAVVAVVAAVAILGATGQAGQQPPPPRFQAGVELVRLDVSVLDAQRNPVRGLSAADFTILEDGKPQDVATFKAIDLPDVVGPKAGEASWVRDVAPDIRGNTDFNDKRVVAIVVDDGTPVATQEVLFYPALVRKVIAGLAPDDLASVVFAVNKSAGQDFTTDRARLLAAVDRINLPIPMPTVVSSSGRAGLTMEVRPPAFDRLDPTYAMNYSSTVNTLRRLSEYLADLPERRKALVFVSVGIPLDISLSEPSLNTAGSGDASGVASQLLNDLGECLRAAVRANVAIYSFDPGGLRAPYGGMTSADPMNAGWANRMFLQSLSENTGGFAVVDNNDPGPGIAQMVRENGSYYLLGYVPTNHRAQGKFRKIEVRVNRPDVTVRARTGYSESHSARPAKASAKPGAKPSALTEAAAGIVPRSELPLEVAAMPFQMPGRRDAAVGLVLGVAAYAPMRATRAVIEVDMAAAAYGMDTKRKASRRQTIPVNLNYPGFGKTVGFELLSSLNLPPGRYQVRLAAETSVHGAKVSDIVPPVALIAPGQDTGPKLGSVYCDVDVPDFLNERLALSGVALSVTPKTVSGPARALEGVMPVVPTALRNFSRADLVGGFVRVSQGGRQGLQPATLAVRVTDSRGATVHQQSDAMDAARFGPSRTADYQFEVPLSKLAPGPHLLTVAATSGDRVVHRDVRFTVLR